MKKSSNSNAPSRRLLLLASLGLVVVLVTIGVYYWPERHLRAAHEALKSRDYGAARASLLRYLEARPKSPEAHLLLAQLDRRFNRYDEAAEHLDACRRFGGASDAIELERALGAIQNGIINIESAKLCYEHLSRQDADEYLILEAFSQGLTKTYRLKEALVCLDRMLVLDADSNYALRRRAWIHFQGGHYDQAETDYRRAVEIDPSDAVARQGLADILLNIRKDFAEAAEHYEQLWRAKSESTAALGLARSWQLLGRTKDARRLLDDWLTDHPDDAFVLAERGKLAREEDDLTLAVTLLRRAVALAPYLPEANYALSECLIKQGRTAEAEECQKRLRQIKEDKEQLAILTRRLPQTPDDADLRCQIAQLFLRLGQEEEGVRWLQAILQTHPDHRPSNRVLADYFDRRNQASQAAIHRRLAGEGETAK